MIQIVTAAIPREQKAPIPFKPLFQIFNPSLPSSFTFSILSITTFDGDEPLNICSSPLSSN
ncbi:hypothetical protein HanHA300_Chr14g0520961 [Helianthus annuus]|nr:hypothetical protein HanHA300_Chr14g0520961 [Helianthus annuus]